jgi:hypothetical protein
VHERQFPALLAEFSHGLAGDVGGDFLVAAFTYLHAEVERQCQQLLFILDAETGSLAFGG